MFGRIIVVAAAVVLSGMSAALAVPPPAASVSGVKNVGWMPGVCSVASLGQLIQQKDPNITPAEVVVRSGLCTQTAWVRSTLVDHPRFLDMGELVDVARLFGLSYSMAWKKGGFRSNGLAKQADSLTVFKTVDEAVLRLKELIAGGVPVQVHVDTAWLAGYGGQHGSHYIVVHAYDGGNVYYCENGGADAVNENVALSWTDFISAWTECYMLWLNNAPTRLDNDWILGWLVRDIAATNKPKKPAGPDAIRAAAAAIRKGEAAENAFNLWMRGTYANCRPYMVEFLDCAGYPALADKIDQACVIWQTIAGAPSPDCNLMEQAADIEDEVLAEISALTGGAEPICLLTPSNTETLSGFGNCTFRWAQMPEVSKTVVQAAMKGDFADKRSVGVFRPKNNSWFVRMAKKDWLKVLKNDGGDRQLSWRVFGPAKVTANVSSERTLGWDIQQMVSTAPVDGYASVYGELVTFTFAAPYVAMQPCVVISATADFNNIRSRIVLKPKRDQMSVSFKTSTVSALQKKDDGDGIVFWRVEDAAAKITTVVPSDGRSLRLP